MINRCITFVWETLVGLNNYVDGVLPALQPHTPDIIKVL